MERQVDYKYVNIVTRTVFNLRRFVLDTIEIPYNQT